HLLSNVTGQAAPVFDAQQEIVCAMTTVTALGQLQSAEDRAALFHEALQVNSNTGAAWPVTFDSRWLVSSAQQEIVCAMTTVTDLGQLQSAEDRDALFHEALQVNQSTGG
ncbi:hypothetical protein ACV34U_30335, partial [Pseudomonas aeruginosa]